MRILAWTALYPPDVGGIETLCAALHPRFAASGMDVTVLTGFGPVGRKPHDHIDGIPIHRHDIRSALASRSPKAIFAAKAAVTAVKEQVRPDLVHLHLSGPEAIFHHSTQPDPPVPTVVTIHSDLSPHGLGGDNTLMRRILSEAEWVTAVSESSLAEAIEMVPSVADHCSFIGNAVAVPAVCPALPGGAPVVALVDRLVSQKAPEVAVQAVAKVRANHPKLTLLIAGDGPERTAVEELVGSLGIEDSVDFRGSLSRTEVASLLSEVSVVMMPSRSEGLPMVALEAAAAGRALLTTGVGGLPEVVRHEETGLVVAVDDVDDLAAGLDRLLSDSELARSLGAAAHEHVSRTASLDACAAAYMEIYERLVPSHE